MTKNGGDWRVGDRVQVSLPYGTDDRSVHLAVIDKIQSPGPHLSHPERTVRVLFDDQSIFGGIGVAWVKPDVLRVEGAEPADPDREPMA